MAAGFVSDLHGFCRRARLGDRVAAFAQAFEVKLDGFTNQPQHFLSRFRDHCATGKDRHVSAKIPAALFDDDQKFMCHSACVSQNFPRLRVDLGQVAPAMNDHQDQNTRCFNSIHDPISPKKYFPYRVFIGLGHLPAH